MARLDAEELEGFAASCDFLSSLMLELPDRRFVEGLLAAGDLLAEAADSQVPEGCGAQGSFLMSSYLQRARGESLPDVLQELAVDRTRLFHGTFVNGIRPPYESLYRNAEGNGLVVSVLDAYRASGYAVAEDVRDAPDYLGVELSFLGRLCRRAATARQEGDEEQADRDVRAAAGFFRDHTGAWCAEYAAEMERFATTDFFRGAALLLAAFAEEAGDLFFPGR